MLTWEKAVERVIELENLPTGKRLRLLRHAAELTIWHVARELKVNPARISEIELGYRENPELEAQILGLLSRAQKTKQEKGGD